LGFIPLGLELQNPCFGADIKGVFLILGIKLSAEGYMQLHISCTLQNKLLSKVQVDVYVLVEDRRYSAVDIIA
jgi:hypothetical protein